MKKRSPDGEDAVVTIRFVKICKMKRRVNRPDNLINMAEMVN